MDLILASTSPYRRELIERLGVPFRWLDPEVDEDPYKSLGLDPHALTSTLAQAKAAAIASNLPEATVIGGDQVAAHENRILGKPGTHEKAREQLASLAGQTHQLITAIAVVRGQDVRVHVDVTTLRVRPLNPDEIERYLNADRPYDCAGSYRLEARGITLFESIESADHTAIVGMPLIALTTLLREFGHAIP